MSMRLHSEWQTQLVRAAPAAATDAAAGGSNAQPITDAQGRVYYPSIDPTTGHLLYTHTSTGTNSAGVRQQLVIIIDIAADGSFTRTVRQDLAATNGSRSTQQTRSQFSQEGLQLAEQTTTYVVESGRSTTEDTRSEFARGKLVGRVTDLVVTEQATDPAGTSVDARTVVRATWSAGGEPITGDTVPMIDRRELATVTAPDAGINKGTTRQISTERRVSGPLNQLVWDSSMRMVVRFNGRGSQYIERELRVPLDAAGTPDYDRAEVIRTDDRQSGFVKAATQARIWGGFAGSWMGIIGSRIAPVSRPVGHALMYAGVGASLAAVGGEGHAIATRRNDASYGRLFMELYDTTWLGLLVASRRRSVGAEVSALATTALTISSIAGSARFAGELLGNGPLRSASRNPARDAIDLLSVEAGNRASHIGMSTSQLLESITPHAIGNSETGVVSDTISAAMNMA
jgi:hypothetical protein